MNTSRHSQRQLPIEFRSLEKAIVPYLAEWNVNPLSSTDRDADPRAEMSRATAKASSVWSSFFCIRRCWYSFILLNTMVGSIALASMSNSIAIRRLRSFIVVEMSIVLSSSVQMLKLDLMRKIRTRFNALPEG